MTDISQEDQELIHRYLVGRLTNEEEFMVETRIVRDAQFRRELALTDALREGMRELEARGEIEGLLHNSRTGWTHPTIAIAASLAALVVASIAYFDLINAPHTAPSPDTTVSLYFERTRSGTSAHTVTWQRSAAPTQLQLHLDVGATPAARYRVAVLRGTGHSAEPVVTSTEGTSVDGEVIVTLDDSQLAPGTFEIRVSPVPELTDYGSTIYSLFVTDR